MYLSMTWKFFIRSKNDLKLLANTQATKSRVFLINTGVSKYILNYQVTMVIKSMEK